VSAMLDPTVWPGHGQWQSTEPHAHWTHAAGTAPPPKRPPQPGWPAQLRRHENHWPAHRHQSGL